MRAKNHSSTSDKADRSSSSRGSTRSYSSKDKKSKDKLKEKENVKQDPEDAQNDIILPLDWNGYDALCLMVLIMLGIFSRFWIIQYPRHFVEKEDVHVGYINSYLNGSFFVDSQPPLSELLLAGIASMSGYRQNFKPPYAEENFTFPTMEYVSLRSPSAFFSTILIPLSYFIVRLLGGSIFASLAAGFFILFDFQLIALGRHISTDGFLQLFVGLAVFFAALLRHFNPSSTSWIICNFLQAFFTGCAAATNWAGFSLVIFMCVFMFLTYRSVRPVILTVGLSIMVLLFSFSVHSLFLPYRSINDIHVSERYRSSLTMPGAPVKVKFSNLPMRAIELTFASLRLHRARAGPKHFLRWTVMGVNWRVLWTQLGRTVASFGNPPVWWMIALAGASEAVKIALSRRLREPTVIVYTGYAICVLFWVFARSERGVCDYQIAFIVGAWGLALALDTELPPSAAGFTLAAVVVAAGFVFLLWAPLVYGYENFDKRFLPYFAK